MGLPAVDPYPMPDRSAVPRSRVPWRIDPARAALLVHDMRNHFVDACPAGLSPVVELVDNMANVRHNAFLRSHLGRLLRSERRDQLIICGVHAHLGVLLTAADAVMNDIQPFVVADAVADFSAEEHTLALRWAARSGVVCTTDGLLRGLLLHREPRNA
ncbi:isochorismatase family protein [Streptomyces sp. NPDC058914]|uniref:isochorismatase family protein n=1 Tax=Streptomyces TaxID=1883 RepID=UPI003694DE74